MESSTDERALRHRDRPPGGTSGGRLGPRFTGLVVAVALGSLALGFTNQLNWANTHGGASGAHVHGLLEWLSVFLGLVCFALAAVAYRVRRDPALIVLGTGLLCAAVMDAFHTLAALHLIEGASPARDLIPFTWAASRMFNAAVRLVGALLLFGAPSRHVDRAAFGASGLMAVGAGVLVLVLIGDPELPQTQYDGLITRPWDVAPLALFAVGAVLFLRLDRSRNTTFTHALVVAAVPDIAAQVHMAFGSSALFDAHFNAAHALKSLAYLVPLVGLFGDYRGFIDTVERAQAYVGLDATLTRVTNQLSPETVSVPAELELEVQALGEIATAFGFDLGHVYLYRPGTDRLEPSNRWTGNRAPPPELASATRETSFGRGEGLPGRVLDTGRASWLAQLDPILDPRFEQAPGARAAVGIPVATDHRFFAVLELYAFRPRSQDDLLVAMMQSAGERLGAALSLVRTHLAMIEARVEAEAASDAKTVFLANMSHELRTPLNGVIGAMALMLEDPLSPEQEELGQIALGSARSLLTLLEDVLTISVLEAGQLRLVEAPFSVADMAEKLRCRFEPRAEARGLQLRVELGELPASVAGDAARLEHVLDNLLDNAVRFTESGWVALRVRAGLVRTGCFGLYFEVEDTGIGIPDGEAAKLFEKFEQADTSSTRKHEGTGLGLAICDQLVQLMGGRLELRSEPMKGSRFSFQVECRALPASSRSDAPAVA